MIYEHVNICIVIVEGHVKRTGTNKGGRGASKTGSFERTYFSNDPLYGFS